MPKKCKACDGVYDAAQRDGAAYFHACSPEVVQHAKFDAQGNEVKPEVRTPRANRRDENLDDSPAAVKAAPKDKNGNAILGPKLPGAGALDV